MKSDLINIKSNLRESFALSPDAAIVTDDGRGCKVVAVDVAHQVIINVGLPRHFGLPVLILLLAFSVFRVLKADINRVQRLWGTRGAGVGFSVS